jgi:hypothetical protein
MLEKKRLFQLVPRLRTEKALNFFCASQSLPRDLRWRVAPVQVLLMMMQNFIILSFDLDQHSHRNQLLRTSFQAPPQIGCD